MYRGQPSRHGLFHPVANAKRLAAPLTAMLLPLFAQGVSLRDVRADMTADSPVTFPEQGALPAKYPPDLRSGQSLTPEEGYYLFTTPQRSLEQIAAIQSEMPRGRFTPPAADWPRLERTRKILTEGGDLRILAVGDSIVNDTMRSAWVAKLSEAYPKATTSDRAACIPICSIAIACTPTSTASRSCRRS